MRMLADSDDTEDKWPNVAAISASVVSGVLVTAAAIVIACAIKRWVYSAKCLAKGIFVLKALKRHRS